MSAKIRFVVRKAAHKSVIVAIKLSDYYGITAANADFPFPSDITCRIRIVFAPKDVAQFPFKVKS